MALYKYVPANILMTILENRSIRFTQPGAFNDPFEMVPELYVPPTFKAQNIAMKFSTLASRRNPAVGELEEDFQSDGCNDIHSRDIRVELDQKIGILSLSKNPSSLLMWSHYADQYAGALIEFDESHEFFKGIFDVEYREKRPKKDISAYVSENDPIIPIAELCIKPVDWIYEAEFRIARYLAECKQVAEFNGWPVYVMDLPFDCIKSITFGERMSVDNQKKVYDLMKDTKISLFLAAIANWGYEFRKEQIKFDRPEAELSPIISPRTAHIFSHREDTFGEVARWQLNNHRLRHVVNATL